MSARIAITARCFKSKRLRQESSLEGLRHWTPHEVTENKSAIVTLPELPTVEKVAAALNALGVTPRDMMAIFQTMKQAGALQAELVIR